MSAYIGCTFLHYISPRNYFCDLGTCHKLHGFENNKILPLFKCAIYTIGIIVKIDHLINNSEVTKRTKIYVKT